MIRKIPEPFATTWLQMVAEEKEKNASSQPPSRGKKAATANPVVNNTLASAKEQDDNLKMPALESRDNQTILNDTQSLTDLKSAIDEINGNDGTTDYITKNKENFKKKADVEVEKVLDRATADWLCDNCNGQNFAKLLSGVVRTKCCKCQAVRGNGGSLVLSLAEVREG